MCSMYSMSQRVPGELAQFYIPLTVLCTGKLLNKHFMINEQRMEQHINKLRAAELQYYSH